MRRVHHGEHNTNKIRIFVTGEVFPLAIDLSMGAIRLNVARDNITTPYVISVQDKIPVDTFKDHTIFFKPPI